MLVDRSLNKILPYSLLNLLNALEKPMCVEVRLVKGTWPSMPSLWTAVDVMLVLEQLSEQGACIAVATVLVGELL